MGRLKTFRARAAAGFAAVIVVTVGALTLTLFLDRYEGGKRERDLGRLYEGELSAAGIELNAERMVAGSRGFLLTGDERALRNVETAEDELDHAIRGLEGAGVAPGTAEHLEQIERTAADYRSAVDRVIAEARNPSSRAQMARAIENRLLPRRAELGREVQDLVSQMDRLLQLGHAEARTSASRQLYLLLLIGGSGVMLSLLFAWRAARGLDSLYASESAAKRSAERAVQAREELLGVVAHDLRNPLNAMFMGASLIRRDTTDKLARKVAMSLERIAGRMEALTEGLLRASADAAHIEAGRFTINPEPCAVQDLVSSTIEMFTDAAAEKSILLRHTIESAEQLVLGDPERLIQVLSNLLSNAVKFTPEGGRVDLLVHAAGMGVRFEVRDTGPGIAANNVPHVFDRYWRAEGGGREGTGLGLYIAKGIIDAHGGRIWVETERLRGAAFVFEVPVAQKAFDRAAGTRSSPEPHSQTAS
jgi:signal transduction histidine kinase